MTTPTSRLHPLDHPGFNAASKEPVWYLSHPIAPDTSFTFEQNIAHVKHIMRLFYDAGVRVVAPYLSIMEVLDEENLEHRRIGLEVDCVVAQKLRYFILSGHKLSSGMKTEYEALDKPVYGEVLDFIGWKDGMICDYIKANPQLFIRP